MNFDVNALKWERPPRKFLIEENRIEIVTEPETDLWQKTLYEFTGDNAPVLQMETDESSFSFTVRAESFGGLKMFDQCGIVIYLDTDNWMKASAEYADEQEQYLGSVLTNHGYCDWANASIPSDIRAVWYRLSRKGSDYVIEYSLDGTKYQLMRMFHMFEGSGRIRFGVYACSPGESSFTAVFTDMELTEYKFDE